MTSRVIVPLRVLIVVLLLLALAAQALVPLAATEAATTTPELSYLQVPYAVAGIATIGCGQVVLVAIWPLLTRVRRGAIFDVAAFRWVGVRIGAGVVATTLRDRKSTRLNSSHVAISYAVFCFKYNK